MIGAHHDGSAYYVSDPTPELGDTVSLRLRVPKSVAADEVHVRTVRDAEPVGVEATLDRETPHEHWWRVELPIHNPVTNYRWFLRRGADATWINGEGEHDSAVTDTSDFRISTEHRPPDWVHDTVWYQIFPDRFSRRPDGQLECAMPAWANERAWTDPIREGFPEAMEDLWGGSLNGVTHHLDHLAELGVNGIYTCPTFPARSNHRYDASAFDHTDPMLGGDEAMARLVQEAGRRGMRVMGDLTTNHSGSSHDWFRSALADPGSPERGYYFFGEGDDPDDYVKWLGVDSLPKFDHRSEALADRLYRGADSIAGRMLGDGMALGALRVDVANMTGRFGPHDLNQRVAQGLRETIAEVRPDAWLLGEHNHDARLDLDGSGWQGSMNYAGFARPVWSWLARSDVDVPSFGDPGPLVRRAGSSVARTARAFQAGAPFTTALSSMVLLGSHDTARWAFVTGDIDRSLVGLAMLYTWPGTPSILYGDEIGLAPTASWDVPTREPFPWADRSRWNNRLLGGCRELIQLRRAHPALARGGMRWVSIGDDHLVWLRECVEQTILVHVARDRSVVPDVSLASLGYSGFERIAGSDTVSMRNPREGGALRLHADGCGWQLAVLDPAV